MSDAEAVTDVDALANRSAFERDILWVLSNEGEQKGVDIRLSLEEYYEKPVNHGQLYPNLDGLVDSGFVEKGVDRRPDEQLRADGGRSSGAHSSTELGKGLLRGE